MPSDRGTRGFLLPSLLLVLSILLLQVFLGGYRTENSGWLSGGSGNAQGGVPRMSTDSRRYTELREKSSQRQRLRPSRIPIHNPPPRLPSPHPPKRVPAQVPTKKPTEPEEAKVATKDVPKDKRSAPNSRRFWKRWWGGGTEQPTAERTVESKREKKDISVDTSELEALLRSVVQENLCSRLPELGYAFFTITRHMPGDQVKILVVLLARVLSDGAFKALCLHVEGCLPLSCHRALVHRASLHVTPSALRLRKLAGVATRALPKRISRNLVRMWLNRTPSEVIKKTAVRAVSGLKSETAEWLVGLAYDYLNAKRNAVNATVQI
ncbi:hypothetical protein AAMO2058_000310100 [Amorphochlora amoebiformis]